MPEQMVCTPKLLPRHKWQSAAKIATEINPVNHPPVERLVRVVAGFSPTPEHISVLTTKYWGVAGLRLTVGFLDSPPADLSGSNPAAHERLVADGQRDFRGIQDGAEGSYRETRRRAGRLLVIFGNRHPQHRSQPADHEPRSIYDEYTRIRIPPSSPA